MPVFFGIPEMPDLITAGFLDSAVTLAPQLSRAYYGAEPESDSDIMLLEAMTAAGQDEWTPLRVRLGRMHSILNCHGVVS